MEGPGLKVRLEGMQGLGRGGASAWRARVLGVLVAMLAGMPTGAWSRPAPSQTLFDAAYARQSSPMRDIVERRIVQLVAPTITCPALVRPGGSLEVRIQPRDGSVGFVDEQLRPETWQVTLRRREQGSPLRLPVSEVARADGGLTLTAALPILLARDLYDLRLMGLGVDETQPNAVRSLGPERSDRFRFVVTADHQLWDPSYRMAGRELSARAFPTVPGEERNLSIVRQSFSEMSLWDPDFVLLPGDFVFGVNYAQEYAQAYRVLRDSRLPIFAVPGNHDAYADYVVKLRGGAITLAAGVLDCQHHLKGDLTWGKGWLFATCMYGDIKSQLYADLHRDGLIYWQRQLGPPAYAFDHGAFRFVGLNTFDGTPERRHAFSIFMDAFDLKLGVPAVDNYGGTLSPAQLEFVRTQARQAEKQGQTLVVFGHHDPRGNLEGQAYHENEPFPTDPLSTGGFEEWNFDGPAWDSDPKDARKVESKWQNSGVELLKILAWYGGYYLSGHVHVDSRATYHPGSTLNGVPVRRRVEFIRTTSAASSNSRDGYWGYRLIEAKGGTLEAVDYDPAHRLGSVPAGNLWVVRSDKETDLSLHSTQPRPASVTLPWDLPRTDLGYRFRLVPLPGSAGPLDPSLQPRVLSVFGDGTTLAFRLHVELPGAPFPPDGRRQVQALIKALPARGNTAPVPVIDVAAAGQGALGPVVGVFKAEVGQTLLFSSERTTDAQNDRLMEVVWDLGGQPARGSRVAHRWSGPGRRTIRLTVVDEAGARASAQVDVELAIPAPPGCGCSAPGSPRGLAAVLSLLLVLGLARRRRRTPTE